jgi:hypothetical protein
MPTEGRHRPPILREVVRRTGARSCSGAGLVWRSRGSGLTGGTVTDYVARWRSVREIRLPASCVVTLALTRGGHDAGVANGLGHPRDFNSACAERTWHMSIRTRGTPRLLTRRYPEGSPGRHGLLGTPESGRHSPRRVPPKAEIARGAMHSKQRADATEVHRTK